MSTAARQSPLFGGPMRIACRSCDTESADGVDVIPGGWQDVRDDLKSAIEFEGAWWTQIGTCPDCVIEQQEETNDAK